MCIAFAYVFVSCIRAFSPLSVLHSGAPMYSDVPFYLFFKQFRIGPRLTMRPWFTTRRPPVKFRTIWTSFDTPTVNRGTDVYLRVSPMKGTHRFGIKGKLSPRYVGPFKIISKRGDLAYQLELPSNFAAQHPSNLAQNPPNSAPCPRAFDHDRGRKPHLL